jgi:hypothetical protein
MRVYACMHACMYMSTYVAYTKTRSSTPTPALLSRTGHSIRTPVGYGGVRIHTPRMLAGLTPEMRYEDGRTPVYIRGLHTFGIYIYIYIYIYILQGRMRDASVRRIEYIRSDEYMRRFSQASLRGFPVPTRLWFAGCYTTI